MPQHDVNQQAEEHNEGQKNEGIADGITLAAGVLHQAQRALDAAQVGWATHGASGWTRHTWHGQWRSGMIAHQRRAEARRVTNMRQPLTCPLGCSLGRTPGRLGWSVCTGRGSWGPRSGTECGCRPGTRCTAGSPAHSLDATNKSSTEQVTIVVQLSGTAAPPPQATACCRGRQQGWGQGSHRRPAPTNTAPRENNSAIRVSDGRAPFRLGEPARSCQAPPSNPPHSLGRRRS